MAQQQTCLAVGESPQCSKEALAISSGQQRKTLVLLTRQDRMTSQRLGEMCQWQPKITKNQGLHGWTPQHTPLLTKKHRAGRLEYTRRNLDRPAKLIWCKKD